jgi:hypothetical protein
MNAERCWEARPVFKAGYLSNMSELLYVRYACLYCNTVLGHYPKHVLIGSQCHHSMKVSTALMGVVSYAIMRRRLKVKLTDLWPTFYNCSLIKIPFKLRILTRQDISVGYTENILKIVIVCCN